MGLFKPIWMKNNLYGSLELSAMARVEKLEGERLTKAATKAPDSSVRKAAVEKLTDQALLAEIALKDSYWGVRKAAVEKLTDQALLAEIAWKDYASDVREAAVKKLTDQAVLAEVGRKEHHWLVHKAVMERLTDPAVREEVALKFKHIHRFVLEDRSVIGAKCDFYSTSSPTPCNHCGECLSYMGAPSFDSYAPDGQWVGHYRCSVCGEYREVIDEISPEFFSD